MNKHDFKIVSELIVNSVDWDRIYTDTNDYSKKIFKKQDIINRIRELILHYPDHFDTSYNRIEFGVSTLSIRYGILNNYIYLLSNYKTNSIKNGWFLNEDYFFEYLNDFKLKNGYCVYFNYKHLIRKLKIEKCLKREIKFTV
ncbi:MAG: hypothetical protein WDA02_10890 [Saccharofermentanales bacterium]